MVLQKYGFEKHTEVLRNTLERFGGSRGEREGNDGEF